MALLRKLFYRKPPDGLLEISERVYVFDCCFTTDTWEEQNYKFYVGGIITQLREHYPDATILVFNFREAETQSLISNALSEYDMTIMEYPRHYEGCPLLPMEVIHHFLRSSESWLSLGLQNLLLMHCERGAWPVLAFMLAALLIYRKQFSGEHKTLDMVYKQAPRELLHLLSPLNPMPSQIRYLQYVSRRNVATEWPPLDRALTMDCVIIRMIPDFNGGGGCRPVFRIYGQDPLLVSDRTPKVLFQTPRKSRTVRHFKQAECELVKIDINCHIQGDVVLECINLHDDMEQEEMMFRAMFNTAFIRSNILMLNRDEIDILWDIKDQFPKDFRAEVLFSEMDTATSIVPVEFSFLEEKDGLPVEAFAKVREIFSSVDWSAPKGDSAVEVLQHINISNAVIEAYSHAEKPQQIQSADVLEYNIKSSTDLTSDNHINLSPESPDVDVGKRQAKLHSLGPIIFPDPTSLHSTTSSTVAPQQLSKTKHSESKAQHPLIGINTSSPKTLSSTPQIQPTKDADFELGRPPFNLDTLLPSRTPGLEDKICAQGGVPLALLPSEVPCTSTPTLKDNTTVRPGITIPSAKSLESFDNVIRDKPQKHAPPPTVSSVGDVTKANRLAPPPSTASLVEDVTKANRFAPPPSTASLAEDVTKANRFAPPPPSTASLAEDVTKANRFAPPPSTASSVEDVTKPNKLAPPPSNASSAEDVTKANRFAPPPPNSSSAEDVTKANRLAPPPSAEDVTKPNRLAPPPPNQLFPHPTKSSPTVDVGKSTRLGPSPLTTLSSDLSDTRASKGGPPPPSTPPQLSSLTKDATHEILSPIPLPPVNLYSAPIKESLASTSGQTPPHAPPLSNSPLKESSASGTVVSAPPPPSYTPALVDHLASKPTPSPPPPPPPPPPPVVPLTEFSSVRGRSPLPPPPPPPPPPSTSPLKEHSPSTVVPPPPPPSTPPMRDNKITRPSPHAPPPPPPPPVAPKENHSIGGAPLPPPPPPMSPNENPSVRGAPLPPPPPLHSRQGLELINPSPMSPPAPPPAPANILSSANNSPPVPSAPPPPFHSNKDGANSSNSRASSLSGSPSPPGPPPPSIPPPGSKGKSLLSRTVTSRNSQTKKLKPLHWLKISRAVSGSLWAEAQKCESSKAPEIDISELESLFSAASNPDQGGSGRKAGSRTSIGHKPEKVQLIDHRRAYNCEIMLSKVKIPLHDLLSSVLALEDSALDVDQVDNLIKFCPTKEEMEVLKGYKGERDKLGKCEQIRGSAKLKRIMQTILSLGNALNQGTARGSAIGFRLDSLLKLTETRARNNKMTLMHYLCKMLADKLPELLDFWQDLSSLEPASKIQLKYLAEEMQAINKGLEKVMQELSMSENDGPISDHFRKALKEFLCFSEGEVRSLASLYSGVGRNVDALILYFGEDPSRCPFEQVISTLLNFVRMFKKAHEENCKQIEFERKKAEKEASEKLKLNASETEHVLQSTVKIVK
ncbi:hypothetical protein RD792_012833 [Penstemon davidsonii]|uniref:Formin-like protein n=1 Tax=Penstemon davidsonii TaxID=160366 RepID=A0ABR0CY03_9LAMI|nr:hypothetical protein RD792_012833 [Penstemon davidsonii]